MRFGRLTQELAVDSAMRIEFQRLRFMANHQEHLRASSYAELVTAERENRIHETGRPTCQHTVLPSSFVGGPRDMSNRLQDSLRVMQVYGTPAFFVTMTCSNESARGLCEAAWHGSRCETPGDCNCQDMPEMGVKVFRAQVEQLVSDARNGCFGPYQAHCYAIEFQKRGLPHVHMLVWTKDTRSVRDARIDSIIAAEASRESDIVFTLQMEKMLHACREASADGGKDGKIGCIDSQTGHCSKGFAKQWAAETRFKSDGFPVYLRRSRADGQGFGRELETASCAAPRLAQYARDTKLAAGRAAGGDKRDNGYIVPTSAVLLNKYGVHINVEAVGSASVVKYLHKYIHKGVERIHAGASERGRDEIEQFTDFRYMSSCRAYWGHYGYPIHGMFPSVIALPVTLLGWEELVYPEGGEAGALENGPARNALRAFYDAVTEAHRLRRVGGADERGLLGGAIDSLTYPMLPQYFRFDIKEREWAIAGAGKTFAANAIIARLRANGKIVAATAATGVASTHLLRGGTTHKTFSVPVHDLAENQPCNFTRGDYTGDFVRHLDLIVLDEGPMQHRFVLEALDISCRDVRRSDVPFGGVVMLVAGDFRQNCPVITRASGQTAKGASILSSRLWPSFQANTFRLVENMRMRAAPGLLGTQVGRYHLRVGNGTANVNPADIGDRGGGGVTCARADRTVVPVPSFMRVADGLQGSDVIDEVCGWVFGSGLAAACSGASGACTARSGPGYAAGRRVLAPHNASVWNVTARICERLGPPDGLSRSIDTSNGEGRGYVASEDLNGIETASLPPHELEMRVGHPYMLLRNFKGKHMNGSVYTLRAFDAVSMLLEPEHGCDRDGWLLLPPVSFNMSLSPAPFFGAAALRTIVEFVAEGIAAHGGGGGSDQDLLTWAHDSAGERVMQCPPLMLEVDSGPHAGFRYRVVVLLGQRYPSKPPQVKIERCWHPNVSPDTGYTCIEGWKPPGMTLSGIMQFLQHLLLEPGLDSPLNVDAAQQCRA
eukprot:g5348.t1